MSGVTTMIGGGTGPAAGTNATTCTPGPWNIARMLQAADALPMNLGFLGKGNASLPEAAHGRYPLVLANILATPLKMLAPLLCAHVDAGGDLVLAGILERQADELKAAYAPWCALEVSDHEDGWILMTARMA